MPTPPKTGLIPNSCSIPCTNKITHARPDASIFGTQFCATECKAADLIPTECDARCDPAHHAFYDCPHVHACPCANPATPARLATFASWIAQRERITSARLHRKSHP